MRKKALVFWFAITAGVAAFALLARTGSTPAQAVEPGPEGPEPAAIVPGLATFVAVDEVDVRPSFLLLRGLLQGGSEVEVRTYPLPLDVISDRAAMQGFAQRCERLALLVLTKPGAYQLDMELDVDPSGSGLELKHCTLRRNE